MEAELKAATPRQPTRRKKNGGARRKIRDPGASLVDVKRLGGGGKRARRTAKMVVGYFNKFPAGPGGRRPLTACFRTLAFHPRLQAGRRRACWWPAPAYALRRDAGNGDAGAALRADPEGGCPPPTDDPTTPPPTDPPPTDTPDEPPPPLYRPGVPVYEKAYPQTLQLLNGLGTLRQRHRLAPVVRPGGSGVARGRPRGSGAARSAGTQRQPEGRSLDDGVQGRPVARGRRGDGAASLTGGIAPPTTARSGPRSPRLLQRQPHRHQGLRCRRHPDLDRRGRRLCATPRPGPTGSTSDLSSDILEQARQRGERRQRYAVSVEAGKAVRLAVLHPDPAGPAQLRQGGFRPLRRRIRRRGLRRQVRQPAGSPGPGARPRLDDAGRGGRPLRPGERHPRVPRRDPHRRASPGLRSGPTPGAPGRA